MNALHVYEFISYTVTSMEVEGDPVWRDYLRVNHRLLVDAEPIALVVAETLSETLKRTPQTVERVRRQAVLLGVGDLLARFDR